MNKKLYNKEKILEWVERNPGISAPEVGIKFGMSRVSAFQYLVSLVKDEKIRIQGQKNATRYFPNEGTYINSFLVDKPQLSPSKIHSLKTEIIFSLYEKYEEALSEEDIDATFSRYCMYISPDNSIIYGFNAFVLWCFDTKHNFSHRISEKAIEYLDIIGTIEFLRGKNHFLNGTETARSNLEGYMDIAFNTFLFCMPSVLKNGFGSTRTSIELRYGKKNSNKYLLTQAIEEWIDPIRQYVVKNQIDACIFTPPTEGRLVQFRDVLEEQINLKIPKIESRKVPLFGMILEPQKDIRDKEKRVKNALGSLIVEIPKEIDFYKHILILDDSFTTGATPNAIALKLREVKFSGRITIITICGSLDYDLAITEEEI